MPARKTVFALSRLAWLRPRFACLACCFVAGFCRKTVTLFSGTCLAASMFFATAGGDLFAAAGHDPDWPCIQRKGAGIVSGADLERAGTAGRGEELG